MNRLALTLPCREHETPYSYVSRLAAFNGSSFAEDFVSDIGVSWQALWDGDEAAIHEIADLASQKPESLLRSNIRRMSAQVLMLGGETFHGRSLQRTSLKVCPLCMQEDQQEYGTFGPYFRAHWALSHYRVCTRHKLPLLLVPAGAHRRGVMDAWGRITDQWEYIDDNATVPQNKLTTKFSQYLIDRTNGQRSNSWLDQFSLELASQLCETLGVALHCSGKRPSASYDLDELAAATEKGFEVARRGPTEIMDALRQARRKSKTKGSTFSGDFVVLHTWLKKLEHNEMNSAPILDVMAEFSFQEYSFAKGDQFLGRRCSKRQNYCPTSLAHEYGLDIVVARKILRKAKNEFTPYRTPIVGVDQLVPMVELFCRSLLPHEAEAALGVDRAVLTRLIANNMLAAPMKIPGCHECFDPHEISKFKKSLFAHSSAVRELSTNYAPMRELRAMYSLRLDVMCQWVASGYVTNPQHCDGATSFQDIALNIEEVRGRISPARRPIYSKTNLKSLLCINDTTIAYLIKENLLFGETTANKFNNRPECRFWPEAIDGFIEKYVPLGLFAKALFMQPYAAQQMLAKNGILPIDLPKHFNRIFLREDLSDDVLKVPLEWRSLAGCPVNLSRPTKPSRCNTNVTRTIMRIPSTGQLRPQRTK